MVTVGQYPARQDSPGSTSPFRCESPQNTRACCRRSSRCPRRGRASISSRGRSASEPRSSTTPVPARLPGAAAGLRGRPPPTSPAGTSVDAEVVEDYGRGGPPAGRTARAAGCTTPVAACRAGDSRRFGFAAHVECELRYHLIGAILSDTRGGYRPSLVRRSSSRSWRSRGCSLLAQDLLEPRRRRSA